LIFQEQLALPKPIPHLPSSKTLLLLVLLLLLLPKTFKQLQHLLELWYVGLRKLHRHRPNILSGQRHGHDNCSHRWCFSVFAGLKPTPQTPFL
jgi:hypothetical protein